MNDIKVTNPTKISNSYNPYAQRGVGVFLNHFGRCSTKAAFELTVAINQAAANDPNLRAALVAMNDDVGNQDCELIKQYEKQQEAFNAYANNDPIRVC